MMWPHHLPASLHTSPSLVLGGRSPKQLFLESSRLVGFRKAYSSLGPVHHWLVPLSGELEASERLIFSSSHLIFSSSAALPFAAKGASVLWDSCPNPPTTQRWQSLRRKQRGILNLGIIWGIRRDDPEAYEILQCIFFIVEQ